jgi:TolB protein
MTITTVRPSRLLMAVFVLSAVWPAAAQAGQEYGANGGIIFFTTDRDNPSPRGMCGNCEEIYVMRPDGSNPVRLTSGGADVVVGGPAYNNGGPDWSHETKLIAFQSNRVGGTPQVYLMRPDGTDQRVLLSLEIQLASGLDLQGTAYPSFSPTGDALCFHSQDTRQRDVLLKRRDIYTVNIDGTGLTNLTSPLGLGLVGDNTRCDWSPNGDAILFNSTRDGGERVFVMNADGSHVRRLSLPDDPSRAPANPLSEVNAAWSPDGARIAFESNRDLTFVLPDGKHIYLPEIWVMNANGTDQYRLTDFSLEPTPSNILVSKPTWSPRGERIGFHRRVWVADIVPDGHTQIYTMNADGSAVTQITFTPDPPTAQFSGFPSWGKWSNKQ